MNNGYGTATPVAAANGTAVSGTAMISSTTISVNKTEDTASIAVVTCGNAAIDTAKASSIASAACSRRNRGTVWVRGPADIDAVVAVVIVTRVAAVDVVIGL